MADWQETFFHPKTVAVIGASNNPEKWGYMILCSLLDAGYAGEVAAVNGRGGEVQGRPAYASVTDLPWAPDLALVVVKQRAAVEAVEALAAIGCKNVVVHTAGFAEIGAEGATLQDRMVAAARRARMRLLGPNCMNIMVRASRLNLTGIPDLPLGRLALVSQSGNFVYDLIQYGRRRLLGLSVFISAGNQADLGIEDFLDYLADDKDTAAVALYLEELRPGAGPHFLSAARRLTAVKPVVALVGGRTEPGRRASASHTGRLLSDTRTLRGLLRQAGVIQVGRFDEFFPVADALIKSPAPPIPSVALCGGGGGHATVGSDAVTARGIAMPTLGPETQAALRALCPPIASVKNPVDFVGASEQSLWVYHDMARLLLDDPAIGGVILFGHFAGYMTERETPANNYRDVALALGKLQRLAGKPILVHSVYEGQARPAFDALAEAGVPLFGSLETAATAFAALVDRVRARTRACQQRPNGGCRDDLLAQHAACARSERRVALTEPEALTWLAAIGIPIPIYRVARSAAEAVKYAAELGSSVALKIVSPQVLHKSDVGGVLLGLKEPTVVQSGFEALARLARERGMEFRGALVAPMAEAGVEVAVGAARTELGGHALLFAGGGTSIEVVDDATARLCPINAADAADMITETGIGRLFAQPRGMAPPSLEPLVDLMVRLSSAVAGSSLIQAVDLNPVRVTGNGIAVLDARVVLAVPPEEG